MTVRQHEVCMKSEGSQSQPLSPEERLIERERGITSHTKADGVQTEGVVGTQVQELGRMPEFLVGDLVAGGEVAGGGWGVAGLA